MTGRQTIFFLLLLINAQGFPQGKKYVEDFTLKDAREGKNYSLSNFRNAKGILVIFNSTECPYSLHYDSRIGALAKKYSDHGISFLMINSNFGSKESAESLDAIKSHANTLDFPYLADIAQDAMNKFGARKNPEVFLLKPENGKFGIFYRGAIDDNPQVEHDVRTPYLDIAINQLLLNRNANPAFVNPAGCIIKK
jgi:thiol-disulfide isomerase/thioredoxin